MVDAPHEHGLIAFARAVDAVARSLGTAILRCPTEVVAAAVDATSTAQDAAPAHRVVFEQRKAEWKAKWLDWHHHTKAGAEKCRIDDPIEKTTAQEQP